MNFRPTSLEGCLVVEPTILHDERGFFARVFCDEEFRQRGLESVTAQTSVSFNRRRNTLRGLHYQQPPHSEAKLVRCTRGRVFDVAVDLRPGSSTFLGWTAAELNAEDGSALYVPPGMAHGFLTLEDDSELFYQISCAHHPEADVGIRWDDPTIGIAWPISGPLTISERDRNLPNATAVVQP